MRAPAARAGSSVMRWRGKRVIFTLVAVDLQQTQASVICREDLEVEAVDYDAFILGGQVTEVLRYDATDSVELVIRETGIEVVVEVFDRGQSLHQVAVVIERLDVAVIVIGIMLVFDLADNLLQYIFNGDQTG